jgi:hypothetical protein
VNRIQALVVGFFVVVWVSLLVILVVAPEVYDQALRLPGGRGAELAVLAALSVFIGVLAVGVVRRWRWTFWLILVAFLFGVLRVPVAALQLTGVLATDTPTWYVLYQGWWSPLPCWPSDTKTGRTWTTSRRHLSQAR